MHHHDAAGFHHLVIHLMDQFYDAAQGVIGVHTLDSSLLINLCGIFYDNGESNA
jgi:hypothetical protein